MVVNQAGARHRATGMHDAADNLPGRNQSLNVARGIDRLEPSACIVAAEPVKKPPGHAVHGRQHHRVRADQGADMAGHVQQCRCLHGDHYQVLYTQLCRVGAGLHKVCRCGLPALQSQSVGLNCRQRRAASHHADVAASAGQSGADPATNGAGAVNANSIDGSWHQSGPPGAPAR